MSKNIIPKPDVKNNDDSDFKYRMSGTKKIPSTKKAATFEYELFETNSLEEMADFCNTHATIPVVLSGDHRRTEFITEVLPWIRLDLDMPGESDKIDKILKKSGLEYIKKPSTSHAKHNYKYHYFIVMENVVNDYDQYKLQYHSFLSEYGIELHDKRFSSLVQNAMFYKGSTSKAKAITTIRKGKAWVAPEIKAPKPRERPKIDYDTSTEDVRKALDKIHPDDGYENWLTVGMALHSLGDTGYTLFDDWSTRSSEYDQKEITEKWKDFDGNSRGAVTLGSLFRLAYGDKADPADIFKDETGSVDPNKKPKSARELMEKYFITQDDIDELENQVYLIDGLILKGALGGFVGDSGSGKSHILLCLVLQILKKHEEMECYFIDIDSGLQYTKDRITTIKSKVGQRFEYISSHKGIDARIALKYMEDLAEYDLTDKIVIFDSLVELAEGELNKSERVNPVLVALKKLRDAGATVLLIHHNNKDGKYAGSFNIRSAMDYTFDVTKDTDTITLDFDKDRGVFENHTFEIVDFNKCKIAETTYFSGEDIKRQKEKKKQFEEDLIGDAERIRAVRTIIEELEIDPKSTPSKTNIKKALHKEFGLNDRTSAKLLNKYEGTEWEHEIVRIHDVGAPGQLYKCLTRKSTTNN